MAWKRRMTRPIASKRRGDRITKSDARRVPHPLIAIAFGIFGYLLWLRYHLFLQSHNQHFNDMSHVNDAPVNRAEAAGSFHLKQLAKDLMASFSAQDGIESADRQGFEISFQTKGPTSTCTCDIVSADCLEIISCLKSLHNPHKRNALAWMGIELRRAMKANSEYVIYNSPAFKIVPLGKLLQYYTMSSWTTWRTRNFIYEQNRRYESIFVDPSQYPDCYGADNGKLHPVVRYNGPTCFYRSPRAPEDAAGTLIEDKARNWYMSAIKNGKGTKKQIRHLLDEFLQKHQPLPKDHGSEDFRKVGSHGLGLEFDSEDLADATYRADFSALGNLMMFAHMTRLQFNRRPFLDKIYKEQLTAVEVPKAGNPGDGKNQTNSHNEDPFIVSLHMRRGDSCGNPNPQEYESSASSLYSKAQTGGDRLCYQTEVYLQAVKRIRQLVPTNRPLHVYLATDDVGNVIHEIFTSQYKFEKKPKKDGTNETLVDSDLGVDKWYFLNITRDHFKHKADSVEAIENEDNQPKLGETAVTDLWLLSHGHAFVGHLGSRFGKVSWLLATARRNNIIPFFSVDGHSFCCEIDENCGKAKAYMTVNNCLTFGHEYGNYDHDNYWGEGSVARKEKFMKDQERRMAKTIRDTRKSNKDEHKSVNERRREYADRLKADNERLKANEKQKKSDKLLALLKADNRQKKNQGVLKFFDRKSRQDNMQKKNENVRKFFDRKSRQAMMEELNAK